MLILLNFGVNYIKERKLRLSFIYYVDAGGGEEGGEEIFPIEWFAEAEA